MQLTSLGLTAENISFATTTMESDKYICVREGAEVIIVDVANPGTPERRSIAADSVIMNPAAKVIALRCKYFSRALQLWHGLIARIPLLLPSRDFLVRSSGPFGKMREKMA